MIYKYINEYINYDIKIYIYINSFEFLHKKKFYLIHIIILIIYRIIIFIFLELLKL